MVEIVIVICKVAGIVAVLSIGGILLGIALGRIRT